MHDDVEGDVDDGSDDDGDAELEFHLFTPTVAKRKHDWKKVQSAKLQSAANSNVGYKKFVSVLPKPRREVPKHITPQAHSSTSTPPAAIKLTYGFSGDRVMLQLHCYDKLSHTVHNADGVVERLPPTASACRKVGRVRKKYRKPYATTHTEQCLKPVVFQEIMSRVQQWDAHNGHDTPSLQHWTDAFSDPAGNNNHCRQHWSMLDNAFSHSWKHTNVYGMPPPSKELIYKMLQYHCIQQQQACIDGSSFRGLYVVPYLPSAPYWSLVHHFQIIQYFPVALQIFTTKHKGTHAPQQQPYVVLYDPGYTEPNHSMAYVHAIECCEKVLDVGTFDYLDEVWHIPIRPSVGQNFASFTRVNDGEVGVEIPTEVHSRVYDIGMTETSTEAYQDGHIEVIHGEDFLGDFSPFVLPQGCVLAEITECHPLHHDRGHGIPQNCTIEELRSYHMHHCSQEPVQLLDQQLLHESHQEDIHIRVIKSAGTLAELLEHDDPIWEEVDKALEEHIEILKERDKDDIGFDTNSFAKDWTKGGLLPLSSLRKLSEHDSDDQCLVIKTKIAGSIPNTSLVDEGANKSVLNIDWYESQGIDWRKKFKIQGTGSIIHMANQVPVETYGKVTTQVELTDAKGKKFSQEFYLMRLGKYNYAQILGFDWKLKFHAATYLPEYIIDLRKIRCKVNAYPLPIKLFHMSKEINSSDFEESTPEEILKDIKLLSTQLRRIHVHVPPNAFIR